MNPFKWFGGGIKDVVDAVGGVIDGLHTSDEEKLDAKMKLVEIERAFQMKMVEQEVEFATQQAQVLQAEIASKSWMARNWRPILMLTFTYIIAHNFVIAPLFNVPSLEIPNQLWDLLKIGLGGYMTFRTVEKVTPKIAEAISKK